VPARHGQPASCMERHLKGLLHAMAKPPHASWPGLLLFTLLGKRTCKPNSVVCGHSSRRRVAAGAHQRPTRRFRQFHEPPERIGPMRSAAWLSSTPATKTCRRGPRGLTAASLPIWSCSVWGLPCPRPHGRGGALLPHHFTLTSAGALAGWANPSAGSGCPDPGARNVSCTTRRMRREKG